MEIVNALHIRNRLGEVLDQLVKTGKPIMVSKGRKIRAVLITPEDYEKRFLDVQAQEQQELFLNRIREFRAASTSEKKSIEVLRELRGYRS